MSIIGDELHPPTIEPVALSPARVLFWLSTVWVVIKAAGIYFRQETAAEAFLPLFFYPPVGIGGVVIVLCALVALVFSRDKLFSAAAVLLPVAIVAAECYIGTEWVERMRFRAERPHYDAVIARLLAASPPERHKICGHSCDIDTHPPLRVSFPEPGGIIDNYTAIVYDPTGFVLRSNEFKSDWSNWDDPNLQKVKKLFGGDMLWAEHLDGPWYRCGFT